MYSFNECFFNSIKETNRLRKEINRLWSKGMSNIYLEVTIEAFSKLRFSGFEKFASFKRAPTPVDIIEFLNFSLQLKNQRSGNKNVCGFCVILILKGIMMLSQKVHAFCWTKI